MFNWMKRFIVFHHKRHPSTMGAAEIRAFLTHLAVDGKVAASTHNVALQALLFLSRQVLKQPLAEVDDFERAKAPGRIPVVLTQEEVAQVLGQLHGTPRLMASLLYGAGLRLMECVRLCVKDLDFPYAQMTVHDGKGAHDRVTVLPQAVKQAIRQAGIAKRGSCHTLRHNPESLLMPRARLMCS